MVQIKEGDTPQEGYEWAGFVAAAKKWTKDAPQVPGWYWCRQTEGAEPFIVQVKEGDTPQQGYEWSGPITPSV